MNQLHQFVSSKIRPLGWGWGSWNFIDPRDNEGNLEKEREQETLIMGKKNICTLICNNIPIQCISNTWKSACMTNARPHIVYP